MYNVIDPGNNNISVMQTKTFLTTIKEVASVTGASTETVSRLLREGTGVSSEIRKRVEETIMELGYQPSELARSLILK
jgi:DNA-binding LacI/PurR family transcriptional regulator